MKTELIDQYNKTIDFEKLDANQTAAILKKFPVILSREVTKSRLNSSTGKMENYTTFENYTTVVNERSYKIGAGL